MQGAVGAGPWPLARRQVLSWLPGAAALAASPAAMALPGAPGSGSATRTPLLALYKSETLLCARAAGESIPPVVGEPARLAVWLAGEPARAAPNGGIPPADCGWLQGEQPATAELVIRASLAWRAGDDPAARLQRLGAVSRWQGITYWSTSEQRRIELVRRAFAVRLPEGDGSRPDFSAEELRSGRALLFRQQDNRSGSAVLFELRGQALPGAGLQVRVRNLEPVRWLGLTLSDPGELQWMQRLEPAADGVLIGTVCLVQRRLHLGTRAQHLRSGVSRVMAMLDALSDRQTPLPTMP